MSHRVSPSTDIIDALRQSPVSHKLDRARAPASQLGCLLQVRIREHRMDSSLQPQPPPTQRACSHMDAIPTAPNGTSPTANPGAVWAAAEILTPSACFSRYNYVLTRNTDGTPEEKLQLDQIRGMQFGGEDDEYLIAGGVAGTAGVVIYQRVDGGRNLTEVARNTDIPMGTSVM
ncbi:hypothetical protein B0H14DRAFT_3857350 [Mycena olivaceomarginata]|nr:hypothetical protein B0H14DRAFT_3857350 [Mycena olivaceomarginata]